MSRSELEKELELDVESAVEDAVTAVTPDRADVENNEREDTSQPNESSTSTTSTTTSKSGPEPTLIPTTSTDNHAKPQPNSGSMKAELAARTCTTDENIFFLKTSKTGSQTLMAIMQRFGIRHNSTFFIGESMNGAMSQVHVPISGVKDCWIGKHLNMKFNISTQHLKYDKNLIDSVMQPGYKRISIIREPTSNFISSYRYYQYLMTPIWMPMGYRTEKKNPPTDILYKEMETMLESTETAHRIINQINPAAFARLGTYRSELLYFGYFIDEVSYCLLIIVKFTFFQMGHEWHSYDEKLPDTIVLKWMEQLENEFDLILIMEHYDISLAVLILKFCWKIEDVIYMKVNEQTKTGTQLSDSAVKGDTHLVIKDIFKTCVASS